MLAEVRAALAGLDGAGNPSSIHRAGWRARALVEVARAEVAALVAADEGEVVLVSGGTEACQLGVLGLARVARAQVVVTSALEHPCVRAACARLARGGFDVREVALGEGGRISADAVAAALGADGGLVALSAVNHELGNLTDVAAVAEVARARGALLFVDAVQALGKQEVVRADAVALSAHKIGGPAGVGALVVRRGVDLAPELEGGRQERGRRGGTENVAGAVGFGAAARAARERGVGWTAAIARLRDALESRLLAVAGARVHGDRAARDAGTLNLGFAGAPGDVVVQALDLEGVCASTGAACSSGTLEPSPVVSAIAGVAAAREAVRLSLGWATTAEEVDRVAEMIPRIVQRVRAAYA